MIRLRDYQERGEGQIRQILARSKRALGIAPTGAGKGQMIASVAARVARKRKKPVIVLHRIELMQQTVAALAHWFCAEGIAAVHVDGDTPASDRAAAIAALAAGEIKVIFNVGLFTEDLDVPALAGVLMLRKTKSLGLYFQMAGTAMRTAPGKVNAAIVDHVGKTFEHGLADEDQVWSLVDRGKKKDADAPVPRLKRSCGCGAVIAIACRTCPHCGVAQPTAAAEIETSPGELVVADPAEVTRARVARMSLYRQIRWAGADHDRLDLVAQLRSYRPGWVYHQQMRARAEEMGAPP